MSYYFSSRRFFYFDDKNRRNEVNELILTIEIICIFFLYLSSFIFVVLSVINNDSWVILNDIISYTLSQDKMHSIFIFYVEDVKESYIYIYIYSIEMDNHRRNSISFVKMMTTRWYLCIVVVARLLDKSMKFVLGIFIGHEMKPKLNRWCRYMNEKNILVKIKIHVFYDLIFISILGS